MDLKRPVQYKDFELNTTTRVPSASGGLISGTQLNAVDFSTVPAVGYTEKRALGDGRDASDVYSDGRRIDLRGQVFGATRSEVYDLLTELRSVFSARLAFDYNPARQGYQNLQFEEPTLIPALDMDSGYKMLVMYARPVGEPSFQIVRDLLGGAESKGGTILYQAALECKDPRVYLDDNDYVFFNEGLAGASGVIVHRGNYPSPVRDLIVTVPSALGAGTFTFTLNGQPITITILDSAVDQIYHYSGYAKTLTLQKSGVTTLKMSLLTTSHPEFQPGANSYSWTTSVDLPVGVSYIRFQPAFA